MYLYHHLNGVGPLKVIFVIKLVGFDLQEVTIQKKQWEQL